MTTTPGSSTTTASTTTASTASTTTASTTIASKTTASTTTASTTTASTTTVNSTPVHSSSGRKRGFERAQVIVVTNQEFDPERNPSYLETVESEIKKHEEQFGIVWDRDLIDEKVQNIDGKFAVALTFADGCDKLTRLFTVIGQMSNLVKQATVICGSETTTLPDTTTKTT
ncbi:hypothetical protein TELCIR_02813 [Teladorsagia circumcincta]|uniref:Uncharacterized protein n=1 Tax=Teladorsagia circumcincta TaxID=45464 RepID=A0A2G9UY86_TELCI|nr:hypothetical protein TELCIR_02813 [Teladorsagia circumcincta]